MDSEDDDLYSREAMDDDNDFYNTGDAAYADGYDDEDNINDNFEFIEEADVECASRQQVREALAHFILAAELPFNFVENPGFNLFCSVLQPLYEQIDRKQAKADCERVVQAEAKKLKKELDQLHRISLTTDLWKSDAQNLEYMVVTAHWVDIKTWTLQKRILSVVHVPPPRTGRNIATTLYNCFIEWGIQKKVHTITVDNTSTNDACMRSLKEEFDMESSLVAGGQLFQVRCTAHIVNLLVQEGMGVINDIIDKIRDCVKYLRASEVRQKAFVRICEICGVPQRKLILDCPTRWNSTYQMLKVALNFQEVFSQYACKDGTFLEFCPSPQEWDRVDCICDFLGIFNDVMEIVSGTQYPTANLYFLEVFRIKKMLKDREFDSNQDVALMVASMRLKFDKYWGQVNLLMSLANTLDPRFKFEFIQYAFSMIYGEYQARKEIDNVRKTLQDLYDEYKDIIYRENPTLIPQIQSKSQFGSESSMTSGDCRKTTSSSRQPIPSWEDWLLEKMKMKQTVLDKSELDMYLEDRLEEPLTNFNVLAWWQLNQHRYRVLSRIALEILAIPISSVTLESAFSAGSRVIDPYKASLSPKTVNMFMCGGDWVRVMHRITKPLKTENEIEEFYLTED